MDKWIAFYIRVSSDKQEYDSQMAAFKRCEEKHAGDKIVWYQEKHTATNDNREEYQRLMADCVGARVQKVYFYNMSRAHRNVRNMYFMADALDKLGVEFDFLAETIDRSTMAGRILFGVQAIMAEAEIQARVPAIKAGQEVARLKGKKWGGSKKGWRSQHTKDLAPTVLTLYKAGNSNRSISRLTRLNLRTVLGITAEAKNKADGHASSLQ